MLKRIGLVAVVVLLTAILATQILILRRMPNSSPTVGALQDAKTKEARTELFRSIPLVSVQGTVDVDVQGTADVEVKNILPVDVEVKNMLPVEVRIVR